MLIDLLNYVISVTAVEVDEPITAGNDTCLNYNRAEDAFHDPAVYGIRSITCYVCNIRYGQNVRYVEPFVDKQFTEDFWQFLRHYQ